VTRKQQGDVPIATEYPVRKCRQLLIHPENNILICLLRIFIVGSHRSYDRKVLSDGRLKGIKSKCQSEKHRNEPERMLARANRLPLKLENLSGKKYIMFARENTALVRRNRPSPSASPKPEELE